MSVTNNLILLCLNGIIHITAIPLREKKQRTLPRSDGCGLNNFDGMFIHCLLHKISVIRHTFICATFYYKEYFMKLY